MKILLYHRPAGSNSFWTPSGKTVRDFVYRVLLVRPTGNKPVTFRSICDEEFPYRSPSRITTIRTKHPTLKKILKRHRSHHSQNEYHTALRLLVYTRRVDGITFIIFSFNALRQCFPFLSHNKKKKKNSNHFPCDF